MSRTLPQPLIKNLWRTNLLVAINAKYFPHVLLYLLPDDPSLGVPEDHSRGLFLNVVQVELLA